MFPFVNKCLSDDMMFHTPLIKRYGVVHTDVIIIPEVKRFVRIRFLSGLKIREFANAAVAVIAILHIFAKS